MPSPEIEPLGPRRGPGQDPLPGPGADRLLFEALFEQSIDAIVFADDEARYVEANAAACELFGLSRAELLERRVPDVAPAAAREEAEVQWRKFRTSRSQTGEFTLLRPDGSTRTVEFNARADVVPGRHLSILRDVTSDRELQRILEERAENDRTREVFVGALGHDLRNPLSAILINAEIARRFAATDRVTSAVDRISSSAHRMARMISDLLDFTRVRQGSMMVERSSADVHQIVLRVLDEIETIHPGRVDSDLRPIVADVDPDRYAQIVSNLVSNGIRHGDGERVRVRLAEEDGQLVLEVHNTGNPIPEEARETMFDPFRRPSRSGGRDGLGLGLYIVRHLVAGHEGEVVVESDAERGTTLRVLLPAPRR